MSDILTDARKWLDTPGRLENTGTHGEECHRWHLACLVSRLADEIARLREERRIVAWGIQFPEGEIVPFEDKQMAELRIKDGNLRISSGGGPADGLKLVALSIEPLPPGPEGDSK